jgi:dimethylargininase
LTTSDLGPPDFERMLAQHREYVRILGSLGIEIIMLDADEHYPDACFVEDTAVVTPDVAVVTRPGAVPRRGEEAAVEPRLAALRSVARIEAPGTVDGGDILVMGERVLIGLSERTNEEGAGQLSRILEVYGMQCTTLDAGEGLHLKSSINALGDYRLLVTPEFSELPELSTFERVVIPADENYAGNSLWVNDHVLVPAGFPATRDLIEKLGTKTVETDVSEFRKMDGGLTCLSIRL